MIAGEDIDPKDVVVVRSDGKVYKLKPITPDVDMSQEDIDDDPDAYRLLMKTREEKHGTTATDTADDR